MKNITFNFGAIRDSISRVSANEIIKEHKSNTLKDFTKEVKKNPTLLKQHIVFKNFEDCKPFNKERLAERFIQQNLTILRGIKWSDVISENKRVRTLYLENCHVESNGGKKDDLFNNIHTLIESRTNPNFSNVIAEQDAYEYVLNYLTRNVVEEAKSVEVKDNPDLKSWDFITKLAVNNFNKRYSHLQEGDKKMLKMLLSDDNKKKNYIEDLRNENLVTINKLLKESKEEERISILEGFKEKLNKPYVFDIFTADDFIISHLELKERLESIK